jgi:hypothetical protein
VINRFAGEHAWLGVSPPNPGFSGAGIKLSFPWTVSESGKDEKHHHHNPSGLFFYVLL